MTNPLNQLRVEGDPNAYDSFAACITAVLRAWGSDVTYDYVEGLSGMAFSPICNNGEDCIGWKMDGCNEYRVDFLGKCLGFRAERVAYEGDGRWLEDYKSSGAMPQEPARYFAQLRDAVQAGKAVIPHSWPAWSVLLGWKDNIFELPFATTPGFEPVVAGIYPPAKATWAFVLTKQPPEIAKREAIAQAIAFGYTVASGDLSKNTGDVLFGGAIFDTIVKQCGMQHLCPSCQENGCIGRSFKRISNGQNASIQFLREAGQYVVSQTGKAALDKAVLDYTEMSDITGKYLDWPALKASHDLPEFRREIAHDFAREKDILARAAVHLRELAEAF
jgi:hypothetical protein